MKQLLLLGFLVPFLSFSQLNCKTIKVSKGDSVLCYHQNGRISTIIYPDPTWERYTHTTVFDQNGNEVYKGSQGYRYGGGSLYLKYYGNGAVSSARSTFQPDGGIQYYDVTTYFNEDGTYQREEDNSRNTHRPTLFSPQTEVRTQPTTPVKTPKVDSVEVVFKNTTGKKVSVLVQSKDSKEKILVHIKKKEVSIGKYLPVKGNHDPNAYFDLILLPTKKKNNIQLVWKPEFYNNERNCIVLIEL
mgnify:CR=1 FL=1